MINNIKKKTPSSFSEDSFSFRILIHLVNVLLFYVVCSIGRRSVLVVSLGVVMLFHCSAGILLFRYSVVFRLFRQFSVVPPALVFRCSASVPLFRRCSVFRSSAFRWFYSMSFLRRTLRSETTSGN